MNPIAPGNPLAEYFFHNTGRVIEKWEHYFEVYHRHFARFRGQKITLLEIGVYHGGSLQMWRDYFGPQARIIGVDINPRCQKLAGDGIEIYIGDQADRGFLRRLLAHVGPIDIAIDDGGHTMVQQQVTLEEVYPAVSPQGVYLAEDLHTSYWAEFGGGYRNPLSFIEQAKRLIDLINAHHSRDPHSFAPTGFTSVTDSLHFYDSILVIEKAPRESPRPCSSGEPAFEEDAKPTATTARP